MSKRFITFLGVAAILLLAAGCTPKEIKPLPRSLAGYTLGEKFEPEEIGWQRTDFTDMVKWEKRDGLSSLIISCDKNGRIQLITQNLFLYNETTEQGDKALVKKYQDEMWQFKQDYEVYDVGQDKGGNEAYVDDEVALTVNMYKEGEAAATRYIKTIKTRALHDAYDRH